MSVRTTDKRALLRVIQWGAQSARTSLAVALQTALQGHVDEVGGGKVLVGTQANGQSVSFQLPASFDAVSAMRAVSELYDLYEQSAAALDSGASDAAIFAEMMDRLKAVKTFQTDHRFLRCA